jgi:hypothetical protein
MIGFFQKNLKHFEEKNALRPADPPDASWSMGRSWKRFSFNHLASLWD